MRCTASCVVATLALDSPQICPIRKSGHTKQPKVALPRFHQRMAARHVVHMNAIALLQINHAGRVAAVGFGCTVLGDGRADALQQRPFVVVDPEREFVGPVVETNLR